MLTQPSVLPLVIIALLMVTFAVYSVMKQHPRRLILRRYVFPHSNFCNLLESEQLFFLRLALIRDDLRHIQYLCLQAVAATNSVTGVEKDLALHQLLFALRMYYGILNEAWQTVQTGWHATDLSAKLHQQLSSDAQLSLKALARYFNDSGNLAYTIRNELAFHYPDDPLKSALKHIAASEQDDFVTGPDSANIFYRFAENVRLFAILEKSRDIDFEQWPSILAGIRKLYDECNALFGHFATFSDAVMVAIATKLNATMEQLPDRVFAANFKNVKPVLFVDTPTILSVGR